MRYPGELSIALVLSALAAVACSDPSAGTLPTPSPSPSASITATPSATAPDHAIEAAVRGYYATLERAVHDPATYVDELDRMIDRGCACRQIVNVLRDEARRGRRADYTLTVKSLSVPNATASSGTAAITIVQSAGRLIDRSGRTVQKISPRTDSYFVDVVHRDGRWLIAKVAER